MIRIHEWIKRERPDMAQICELINFALGGNPSMSLAEFADILDKENVNETYRRLLAAEEKQFSEGDWRNGKNVSKNS